MKNILLAILAVFLLAACSEEEAAETTETALPSVTYMMPLGGGGDNGYEDLALSGMMQFNAGNDVELSLLRPASMDEAREKYEAWKRESDGRGRRLLVLGGSDYAPLVRADNNGSKDCVLLFESRQTSLPEGVHTFYIQRYGACYLAGCMAQRHEAADIVAAMENEENLQNAIHGFTDGYNRYSGREAKVHYLSSNEQGYVMADSAYRLSSQLAGSFVLPLAGGSNLGIYKYSRETMGGDMLVAGMDTDTGLYSQRVPFSVVIGIDRALRQWLTQWLLNNGEMPQSVCYGLADGMTGVTLSQWFSAPRPDAYWSAADYWSEMYGKYYQEAIEEERKYENR